MSAPWPNTTRQSTPRGWPSASSTFATTSKSPANRGAGGGADALVRDEAGGQADQESRSVGSRAAVSVTAMDLTIHIAFLPHDDPDAALAFYRDTLGFEVRNDVGYGGARAVNARPPRHPAAPPPPAPRRPPRPCHLQRP